MVKPRPYYILAVKTDGQWTMEFGDYARSVVVDEFDDYLEHDYRRADLKIVRTSDTQSDVTNCLAKLNGAAAAIL